MDYFSFQFTSRPQGQEISFTGRAYPLHEQLPSWAEWIADLWIAAYLSDNQGQVLAKDLRMYSSRPLDYEQGIPFSFVLKPSELGSAGPLYVTFGYRLVLTAVAGGHARYDLGLEDEQDVFFANESALSRF
jgi:hypothetical protein